VTGILERVIVDTKRLADSLMYCVRLEAISGQLGHSSVYMAATVYARFKPTIEERKSESAAFLANYDRNYA
jgi:hypothetical protein